MTRDMDTIKMSYEEMIDTLEGLVFGTFDRTTAKEREALDMVIKLQAEHCEDAISREDVIKEIDRHTFDTDDGLCLDEDITIILEELPTVKPTRKKGKWIKSDIGGAKVCSICQAHMGLSNFNYCPNCGAKMGSEE